MEPSLFGSPRSWRDDDLIGVSREVDAEVVVAAYRAGVFPMPLRAELMGWWSPLDRGILPLDGLRVTRSLRKMIPRYEIRIDSAFDEVLARCADPERPGSWIDDDIQAIYRQLHREGIVHSVEAWTRDGELAGGLYGVSIGGLFAGESMFHDPEIGRDASKVALVALVELLREAGGEHRLLDVQWQTPHLSSLGVVEIDREDYLRRLGRALRLPSPSWLVVPSADSASRTWSPLAIEG
ncbi:MAG: leucyl/phenylalanyl-tRNA--protein transferase [Microlunatus sp.]